MIARWISIVLTGTISLGKEGLNVACIYPTLLRDQVREGDGVMAQLKVILWKKLKDGHDVSSKSHVSL